MLVCFLLEVPRLGLDSPGPGILYPQDIDDIHFHMEHLGQHAEQLETLLAFMLRPMQAQDLDTAAPVGAILAPTPQMDNTGNVAFTWDVGKRAGEVETNSARHRP
jgi:hypothetical protein